MLFAGEQLKLPDWRRKARRFRTDVLNLAALHWGYGMTTQAHGEAGFDLWHVALRHNRCELDSSGLSRLS